MKLLFDQNLSPRLATSISDIFPGCAHVEEFSLGSADDVIVWEFAATNGFVIVSKDSDFVDLALMRGAPPKVISITLGNCSTSQIESLLRMKAAAISDFEASPEGLLYLP